VQLRTNNGGRHERRRTGGVCRGRIGSAGVVMVMVVVVVVGGGGGSGVQVLD